MILAQMRSAVGVVSTVVIALAITLAAPTAFAEVKYTGVNFPGLEFDGKNVPGRLGHNYFENSEEHYDYWAQEKGANIVRLLFKWERLQHKAFGPLDLDYLTLLHRGVAFARKNNMIVILDLHNYGEYYGKKMSENPRLIGAFVDVWTRLAHEFKNDEHVWFNLMNEPKKDMPADLWVDIVDATTLAIRQAGAKQKLVVPTVKWSGAHEFNKNNYQDRAAYERYHDPENNFVFEVHQYLDRINGGFGEDAVNFVPGKGGTVLKGVTEWAREKGFQLFMGEFGVTDANPVALKESQDFLQFMDDNSDVFIGWTAFTAGESWRSDYFFLLGEGYSRTKLIEPYLGR